VKPDKFPSRSFFFTAFNASPSNESSITNMDSV
jgi:hypothetical protein